MKKKKTLTMKLVCLLTILYFSYQTNAQDWIPQTYDPDVENIEDNPLRGLMPSYNIAQTNLPYTVDHFYIALNLIVTGEGEYDWDEFEKRLNTKSVGGRTVVPRVWAYYPFDSDIGVPQYLIDNGLLMFDDPRKINGADNGSSAPNWADQNLVNCFLDFIEEFGNRYDGDPRIAMIEMGLYGSWGEWNTAAGPVELDMDKPNLSNPEYYISMPQKESIVRKYTEKFKKTYLGLRRADRINDQTLRSSVGYYDDSWGMNTLSMNDDWRTMSVLTNTNQLENYKNHPFAGEIRPEIQDSIFDRFPETGRLIRHPNGKFFSIQNLVECVNQTHVSFIRCSSPYGARRPIDAMRTENAIKMIKSMGYTFFVSQVKLDTDASNNLTVDVKIENKGIAPFYYNWDVEFAAMVDGNTPIDLGRTDWDITQMFSDGGDYEKTFTAELPDNKNYKILMRFVNPLENYMDFGTDVKTLRFANAKQDEDVNGWLTLGAISDLRLSVNTIENDRVTLYPNPVNDILHINLIDAKTYNVSLINILGKEVLNRTNLTGKNSMNIKSLGAGIYFAKISTETEQTVKKIIIK